MISDKCRWQFIKLKMTRHVTSLQINIPLKKVKIEDDSERLVKLYEKMQDNYIKDGQTQQVLLILKSIVKNAAVPPDLKALPLLRMLIETCKEFLLNELEITLWSIFLDKLVWGDRSKLIQVLLLYTAYAAKSHMNMDSDIQMIKLCVANKHSGFFIGYEKWYQLSMNELSISFRHLNHQYNSFLALTLKELVDYNFYVDDLLQIAPPSGVCEKEIKLEFIEEPDELKLPELMNLNSVLENTEMPMLMLSRTYSLDANKELGLDPIENYTSDSPTKVYPEELYQF